MTILYKALLAENNKENANQIIAIQREHQRAMLEIMQTLVNNPSITIIDSEIHGGVGGRDYSGDVENSQQQTNDDS
ncbi:MAG: hypothetical protein AB4041_05690 [Microcystaceae cyanobacterium]